MKTISSIILLLVFNFASIYGQVDATIVSIEDYLTHLSKDENFSASISISKDETIVLEKAYGFANREHQIPNDKNTTFNIASIGKLFTAVSVLQLFEQGKVDLDQVIGKYLPDFPNQYIKDSVTIHQLLTHSSGLPLWFNKDFDQSPKFDFLHLDDYLPLYKNVEINRAVIGKNSYSNVGYITLGFLIEALSDLTYKAYLNKHIFEPLKMAGTNIWSLTEIIPKVATGYIRPSDEQDWWKTNYHLNKGSSPAGGAYATSSDLIKFYNGLLNDKLLKPATKTLMLSPKIETYYGHYGYGIGISKNNEKEIIGHLGGYYGIRGELMWYKDAGYIVSILANSDQTDYADISYFIKNTITGTAEQQVAYKNTIDLINSKKIDLIDIDEGTIEELKKKKYDESLIQIKGYYYFNNKDYAKAKIFFTLNSILFPDSEGAKRDVEKVTKK